MSEANNTMLPHCKECQHGHQWQVLIMCSHPNAMNPGSMHAVHAAAQRIEEPSPTHCGREGQWFERRIARATSPERRRLSLDSSACFAIAASLAAVAILVPLISRLFA